MKCTILRLQTCVLIFPKCPISRYLNIQITFSYRLILLTIRVISKAPLIYLEIFIIILLFFIHTRVDDIIIISKSILLKRKFHFYLLEINYFILSYCAYVTRTIVFNFTFYLCAHLFGFSFLRLKKKKMQYCAYIT